MAIHELVLGYVAAGDHRLMRRVNRWTPPFWLRRWMVLATRGGDCWLWYAAGLAVLLFGGPERYAALGFLFHGALPGGGAALQQLTGNFPAQEFFSSSSAQRA